jgi:hypothetical protein
MSGYKNLGSNVSQNPQDTSVGGQFSAAEKSFESLVVQEDKPVIDWEMNVRSEIKFDHGLRSSNSRKAPSCFLTSDFLERPNINGSYIMLSALIANANKFRIRSADTVINGWIVRFEYSNISTANLNEITLPSPPVSGVRIDLVILEVWRALVIAAPSVANKSPTGLIVRHGNVKAPDAVNLTDDLIDPNFAAESSARVQIQYRYRVISNVDVQTYPDGLDDPSVVANSVSDFTGPGADGSATIYTYTNDVNDKSLWRAGNGDSTSATNLGTVDGYMYAVPVCAVARRNTTAFDRNTNLNGGVLISAGTSDRPDGLFSDQIIDSDIKDLRKGCIQDFQEVLEKTSQFVLNNTLATELEITAGNTAGTSVFFKDDIGVGGHTGDPDRVRRSFSDRSVTETVVCKITVGGATSAITFDLSSLEVAWASGTLNLLTTAPTGTNIASVNKVRIVDTAATTDKDGFDGASPYVDNVAYTINIGPGVDQATLNFNTPITNVTVYAELAINYPAGNGLSRNVKLEHDFWAPAAASIAAWVDSAFFTVTSDANRYSLSNTLWEINKAHRETFVNLVTISQINTFYTSATDTLYIWERLDGSAITINDGTNPPYATTNYTQYTAYTVVTLTGGTPIGAGTSVSVTYVALRALPEVGVAPADSYQVFYQSAAIQSLLPPAGTITLPLIPRAMSDFLYIIGMGSGSPDEAMVMPYASTQLPVGSLPAANFPESKLAGPIDINVVGIPSEIGFFKVAVTTPYIPSPDEVTLFRNAPDVVTDADGRNFWPKSDDGTVAVYSPSAITFPLGSPRSHKVALPVLMELKEDFASIGRKGTLILIIYSAWVDFSIQNFMSLTDVLGDTAAAVYRVRGNLMNSRRADI